MTILIEDSPRNLMTWIKQAIDDGLAEGTVISPFATPWTDKHAKRQASVVARELAPATVWFDATTHALQMAGVGDFRYYGEYNLWPPGHRNDLSDDKARREHVKRVFEVQDTLGSNHLAPTILLHHGESTTSEQALRLAEIAVEQDSDCWVTVAGSGSFWSSGKALDSHIGALVQLDVSGWFVTVARPSYTLPVEAQAEEVHGVCRTARALSEDAVVHVSHGDVAALPAVAAGAQSLGSGWDQRQRVCAYSSFTPRPPAGPGGAWYQRPTLKGLLGSLKETEGLLLENLDSARLARLGSLPAAPGPGEAFRHHLKVLGDMADDLITEADNKTRYEALIEAYVNGNTEWPEVVRLTGSVLSARDWIAPHHAGLLAYGHNEGW